MTTVNANDFEKVTSGPEIWNREIQKLLPHFLRNRDRDDRSFKLGVIKYTLDTGSRETEDLHITRNEFLVIIILLPHSLSEEFLWNGWTDHNETS
jgi:hypothetical protein